MNREEAFEYIEIAAENRLKTRMKYTLEDDYDIDHIKDDIEYYEKVMIYIKENLK